MNQTRAGMLPGHAESGRPAGEARRARRSGAPPYSLAAAFLVGCPAVVHADAGAPPERPGASAVGERTPPLWEPLAADACPAEPLPPHLDTPSLAVADRDSEFLHLHVAPAQPPLEPALAVALMMTADGPLARAMRDGLGFRW